MVTGKGGVEVYRSGGMKLRISDRTRWTRTQPGSDLVNRKMAQVESVEKDCIAGGVAETKLHRGWLSKAQKEAVKAILTIRDRVSGIQGYAGTGKTTMLDRVRSLAERRD